MRCFAAWKVNGRTMVVGEIAADDLEHPQQSDVLHHGFVDENLFLTREQLESTEEGRQALAAWTAGDDTERDEFEARITRELTLKELRVGASNGAPGAAELLASGASIEDMRQYLYDMPVPYWRDPGVA